MVEQHKFLQNAYMTQDVSPKAKNNAFGQQEEEKEEENPVRQEVKAAYQSEQQSFRTPMKSPDKTISVVFDHSDMQVEQETDTRALRSELSMIQKPGQNIAGRSMLKNNLQQKLDIT